MESDTNNKLLNSACILRLARKAGIKILSSDAYPVIEKIIREEIETIMNGVRVANNESGTKTILYKDLELGLSLLGRNELISKNLIRKN